MNNMKKAIKELLKLNIKSRKDLMNAKRQIAKKYGKVYDFRWCDDFSKARNFSISKATKDWILVLDADEIISKDDLIKIKEKTRKSSPKYYYY